MNRLELGSWTRLGTLVLAGFLIGAWSAPADAATATRDEAAIRAQTQSWGKAFNGGDPKGVASLYAEDALLLPPGASGVAGRASIEEFFTKEIASAKGAGAVFILNPNTDVGVSGNTGWESGTYSVTVNGSVVETGKFLSVSRKINGKWLYIRDTWNADAPVTPPAAK
jgi:uncharacterized protein (TIGR02246 family)